MSLVGRMESPWSADRKAVSSGVCGADGLAKDAAKVEAFVAAAKQAGGGSV